MILWPRGTSWYQDMILVVWLPMILDSSLDVFAPTLRPLKTFGWCSFVCIAAASRACSAWLWAVDHCFRASRYERSSILHRRPANPQTVWATIEPQDHGSFNSLVFLLCCLTPDQLFGSMGSIFPHRTGSVWSGALVEVHTPPRGIIPLDCTTPFNTLVSPLFSFWLSPGAPASPRGRSSS